MPLANNPAVIDSWEDFKRKGAEIQQIQQRLKEGNFVAKLR